MHVIMTAVVVRHKILRPVLIGNTSRQVVVDGFRFADWLPAPLTFALPGGKRSLFMRLCCVPAPKRMLLHAHEHGIGNRLNAHAKFTRERFDLGVYAPPDCIILCFRQLTIYLHRWCTAQFNGLGSLFFLLHGSINRLQ